MAFPMRCGAVPFNKPYYYLCSYTYENQFYKTTFPPKSFQFWNYKGKTWTHVNKLGIHCFSLKRYILLFISEDIFPLALTF